jgi:hypothetical protein
MDKKYPMQIMLTNTTVMKPLRVGYHPILKNSPRLIDGLESILDGFPIEFVRIDNYAPFNRNSNGEW